MLVPQTKAKLINTKCACGTDSLNVTRIANTKSIYVW